MFVTTEKASSQSLLDISLVQHYPREVAAAGGLTSHTTCVWVCFLLHLIMRSCTLMTGLPAQISVHFNVLPVLLLGHFTCLCSTALQVQMVTRSAYQNSLACCLVDTAVGHQFVALQVGAEQRQSAAQGHGLCRVLGGFICCCCCCSLSESQVSIANTSCCAA